MHLPRPFYLLGLTSALALALAGCGGGGSGGGSTTPTVSTPGAAPAIPAFSALASAPNTLSGTAQTVSLPTVPGVSSVGGTLKVQSSGSGSAAVMVAPVSGSNVGPPIAAARRAFDAGSGSITPVYYVGITNTGTTSMQVQIGTLALSVPALSTGWSYALACYDPSKPTDAWNEDCAFGPTEVSVSGTTATFTLNQTFTIYPGVTLWFAPYAYPSTLSSPTPEPSEAPIVPTPPPAPSSLTGTYVGNANGQSDEQYLEVSLTQSGSNVTGIYALVPDGHDNGGFGTLSGTVSNGTLTLTATQQYGGNCGNGSITATVSGTLINGTFTPTTSATCSGGSGGTFTIALQGGITQTLSGSYKGTINDAQNGAGNLTIGITTPGTVFAGNASVTWQSTSQTDSGAIVGFMVNSTTAQFAVITNGSCAPMGTIAISGTTLNGTYQETGGENSNCSGSGSFTVAP